MTTSRALDALWHVRACPLYSSFRVTSSPHLLSINVPNKCVAACFLLCQVVQAAQNSQEPQLASLRPLLLQHHLHCRLPSQTSLPHLHLEAPRNGSHLMADVSAFLCHSFYRQQQWQCLDAEVGIQHRVDLIVSKLQVVCVPS